MKKKTDEKKPVEHESSDQEPVTQIPAADAELESLRQVPERIVTLSDRIKEDEEAAALLQMEETRRATGRDRLSELPSSLLAHTGSFSLALLAGGAEQVLSVDLSAAYLRWLFFAAGPLEQAITARKLAWEVPQERTRMVGFGTFEDTLNTVQQGLLGGPWLCGNHFTAADLYLAAQLGWAMSEGVVPERPGFADFVATAFQRPAALRAKAFNDQYLTSA